MKHSTLEKIYYSLNEHEKYSLQVRRQEFEGSNNIRFINLESYVNHLALEIVDRERNSEFLPRSEEEAIAGYPF